MRALARIFSALVLLMALGLAALWIYPQLPQKAVPTPPLIGTIDRILIEKAARRMVVFRGDVAVKQYRVALGSDPIGTKIQQGDGRTPEGTFTIDRKNAGSAFHLSLGISYPTAADRARAKAGGYDPGGDIMIHGQPKSWTAQVPVPYDWTAGCIAVSNAEIDEIFAAAEVGTTVEIKP